MLSWDNLAPTIKITKNKMEKRIKQLEIRLKQNELLILALTLLGLVLGGVYFNTYVMATNGGRMPVYIDVEIDTIKHFNFQEWDSINAPYYSDCIRIGKYLIMSIGDILIYLGLISILIVAGFIFYYHIKEIKNDNTKLN